MTGGRAPGWCPLTDNPFRRLGVGTRTDRAGIAAAAERAALAGSATSDDDRATLTRPLPRLAAELAWLPGCTDGAVETGVETVLRGGGAFPGWAAGAPPLAHANLRLAGFLRLAETEPPTSRGGWLAALATALDQVSADALLPLLNRDREAAGQPRIARPEAVAEALETHREQVSASVRAALDGLPTRSLIATLAAAARAVTRPPPLLLVRLADRFELDIQGFVAAQRETALSVAGAAARVPDLNAPLRALSVVLADWEVVLEPLALVRAAQGLEVPASVELGRALRNLAVDAWNLHQNLEAAWRLTLCLRQRFSYLPEFASLLSGDIETLQRMRERSDG